MTKDHLCCECPAYALKEAPAELAIVQLAADGENWVCRERGTPVHIAALFRGPDIGRPVKVVLDLHCGRDGYLRAGIADGNCWVRRFLKALRGLPRGITVALDNGVRCPSGDVEQAEYRERAWHCHKRTVQWFSELQHPCGGSPGIVVCDRALTYSLADFGHLMYRNGEIWREPKNFIKIVGREVTYMGVKGIILAHPVIFNRKHKCRYRQAFADKKIVSVLTQLARLDSEKDNEEYT